MMKTKNKNVVPLRGRGRPRKTEVLDSVVAKDDISSLRHDFGVLYPCDDSISEELKLMGTKI